MAGWRQCGQQFASRIPDAQAHQLKPLLSKLDDNPERRLLAGSSHWHSKPERPLKNAQQPFMLEYLLCITNSSFRSFALAVNGSFHISSTAQGRFRPTQCDLAASERQNEEKLAR